MASAKQKDNGSTGLTATSKPAMHHPSVRPIIFITRRPVDGAGVGSDGCAGVSSGLLVVGLQQRLLSSTEAFARSLKVHRQTVKRQWEKTSLFTKRYSKVFANPSTFLFSICAQPLAHTKEERRSFLRMMGTSRHAERSLWPRC